MSEKRSSARYTAGSAREVPERCPRGAREMPEKGPRGAREMPERCFSVVRRPAARELKKSGDSARSCPIFSVRMVKLPSVFVDFRENAFSTAGAMNFHYCSKTPRLCRKFVFTAPVQKNERPIAPNGSES